MNSAKSIRDLFTGFMETSMERPKNKLERELAPLDMIPFVGPLAGGVIKSKAMGKYFKSLQKLLAEKKAFSGFLGDIDKQDSRYGKALGSVIDQSQKNIGSTFKAMLETPQKEFDRIDDVVPDFDLKMPGTYEPTKRKITMHPGVKDQDETWYHEMAHARTYKPNTSVKDLFFPSTRKEIKDSEKLLKMTEMLRQASKAGGQGVPQDHDALWNILPVEGAAVGFSKKALGSANMGDSRVYDELYRKTLGELDERLSWLGEDPQWVSGYADKYAGTNWREIFK